MPWPDLVDLSRRLERAIRAEFGVDARSPTGRATDCRCFLACAALAAELQRQGYRARWVGGTLAVEKPGVPALDIILHAVVLLEDQFLIDPTISQADRARWAGLLDIDVLCTRVTRAPGDGDRVQWRRGDLSLTFTASESVTRQARALPDLDPARTALILAHLDRQASAQSPANFGGTGVPAR